MEIIKKSGSGVAYPVLDIITTEQVLSQIQRMAESYLDHKWIYGTGYNGGNNNNINNSRNDGNFLNVVGTVADDDVFFNHGNNNYGRNQFVSYPPGINDSQREMDDSIDDLGIDLSKVFVFFYSSIVDRLNKLPQKNYISFLNMLGFGLSTPVPSKVPVTFKPTENAVEDIFVPKGTRVSAPPNDEHEKELVFESIENMLVSKASMLEVYSVDESRDAIYGHAISLQSNDDFQFFADIKNGNMQEHVLYLGNDEIFNFKKSATPN